MKITSKNYIFCFLLSCICFSNCGNKCKNERFYCRDENIIDKDRNIRFVKIFYHGELLEDYFSSNSFEKDSSYTHYYNGYKSYTMHLKNGFQNGLAISFYNNGDTESVQHYKNDTLNGIAYGFYLNKKIKYKQEFRMGECLYKQVYDSIK